MEKTNKSWASRMCQEEKQRKDRKSQNSKKRNSRVSSTITKDIDNSSVQVRMHCEKQTF